MATLSPRLPGNNHRRRGIMRRRYRWALGLGVVALLYYVFVFRRGSSSGKAARGGASRTPTDGVSTAASGDIFSGTVGADTAEKAYRRAAHQEEAAQAGELIQDVFPEGLDTAEQAVPDDEDGMEVDPGRREVQGGGDGGRCRRDGWQSAYAVSPLVGVDYGSRGEREWWLGGVVAMGTTQPLGSVGPSMAWELDLHITAYNQNNPVLVSNKGRYLWFDTPRHVYAEEDGTVCVNGPWERGEEPGSGSSSVVLGEGHQTLRAAFLAASAAHFPPTGRMPDELLFTAPQYNLWIECNYYPTQEKVLGYAKKVVETGLSPGVLMIDTNWALYYGSAQFDANRFPDPKAMIDELHELGFKVMLWVSPFISPDSPVFRYARRKKYLVKNHWGGVGIPEWWDGHSAVLDARNSKAASWFTESVLDELVAIGVDGFKFDGGDPDYYRQLGGEAEEQALEHTKAFAALGLSYNLSEYRACYKQAGTHLVQRLSDKSHTWNIHGLGALLPNGLLMGLMGYAFSCPDMIGGGQYTDFYDMGTLEPNFDHFDQELFVRYTQASAVFPMMQFSLAPWRMLDATHLEAVVDAAALHADLSRRILQLAREAASTGEPIIRSMEYVFPNQGYAEVRDQFLLGDGLLVAPILVKGHSSRLVRIPPGTWVGQAGAREEDKLQGPKDVWVDGVGRIGSPVTDLMYFIRVD